MIRLRTHALVALMAVNYSAAPGAAQPVRERATLSGHQDAVEALAFSPDGRMLASSALDGTARLWEVATGRERLTLPKSAYVAKVLSFGTRQLLYDAVAGVGAWDVYAGAALPYQPIPRAAFGHHLVASENCILAGAHNEGDIVVWRQATGAVLRQLAVLDGPAGGLALSRDGRILAAINGGAREGVQLWDIPTGRRIAVLKGHPSQARGLAFAPDGRGLATTCWDGEARLWDAATGKLVKSFVVAMDESVLAVAFSPDGKRLAAGCSDGAVWFWNVADGRELARLPHADMVYTLAFSADGSLLAAGCGNRFGKGRGHFDIKLWDLSRLRP